MSREKASALGATGVEVLDGDGLAAALRRIGHEIIENNDDLSRVVMLGIPTRGVPLAHRLAQLISGISGVVVPAGSLDVSAHRDDITQPGPGRPEAPAVPAAIDGATVIVIDDVLHTGRTVRAALDAINDLGRPGLVQVAVVVDRGHRELPVRPDYVGKNLPTSPEERVGVMVTEVDGRDGVMITRSPS